MIRCIPVDGGEPFEVDDLTPCNFLLSITATARRPASKKWSLGEVAVGTQCHGVGGILRLQPSGIEVSVESWRERAIRLEKELAISRAEVHYLEDWISERSPKDGGTND